MNTIEILKPVYSKADGALVPERSERKTIEVLHWKPVTKIRNSDNGVVYTTISLTVEPDQDFKQSDLILWPQGLTPEEFETKGRHLSILSWYPARGADGEIHHIEVEA
ncbi:hypothetical protein [Leptospira santarosai]|uniref:hypothetical protein n=1 Tax=Leptospira santarosai TaxID=28183 RepID=UPI0026E14EDE|nr:hypothetical protein [Leptospira santarosai]MDO6383425.1 hypothetical protein [Leptospira santarosai]